MKLRNILNEIKKIKDEVIFDNDWITLNKKTMPHSTTGYIYSHEKRCDGKIVAVLLYKRTGKDGWQFGVRNEVVPCWNENKSLCSLTGGIEKDQTPEECAIMEIKEEAGYDVTKEELENLGTCVGTKSTDTTYYLFACDVGNKEVGKATGDGAYYDDDGDIKWMYYDKTKINDPILCTMILRFGYY